jgi:hypothetical protein
MKYLALILLLFSGCETIGYLRERHKPIQVPVSALTTALSPRPLFVRPSRSLMISDGQLITDMARGNVRYVEQVMGSSAALPFKEGSFSFIKVGTALIDRSIAKELWRVTDISCIAAVKIYDNGRHFAMLRTGWATLWDSEGFRYYRKEFYGTLRNSEGKVDRDKRRFDRGRFATSA